jgi:hypothetical protein
MAPAVLLVLCLLIQSAPKADPVAKVGDQAFSRADYAEYLVVRAGVPMLYDYVCEQVILIEAGQRGLLPTEAEVAAAYDAELAHIVEAAYGGQPERWVADQAQLGYSPETARLRRLAQLRAEVALAKIIRADRDVSEERVAQRFHELFGDPPERTSIEVLFFNAYRGLSGTERPDLAALKQAARERASTARAAWLGGAQLADLLPGSDDPSHDEIVQGVVAEFRPRTLGKTIDAAVAALDQPGDVSQPLDAFDGAWLVRLVSRKPVALEQVRQEVEDEIRDAPIDTGEINTLRAALMARYQPELLLR